jgi:hypothetical protein
MKRFIPPELYSMAIARKNCVDSVFVTIIIELVLAMVVRHVELFNLA